MKDTVKDRNKIIDILKGVAVISVLLGHAVQRGIGINGGVFFDNYIFKVIYSYHMPLFMLLSGYVLAKFTKDYNLTYLLKKARRLLLPTILWSYIIWGIRNFDFVGIKQFIVFPDSFLEYTKTLFFHPDLILWFLYDIFIFNIWFFIQNNINKKKDTYLGILLSIFFYLILLLLPPDIFGIYSLQTYFPIYAFGYYLKEDYLKQFSWKYILICFIAYIFLLFKYPETFLTLKPVYYLIAFSSINVIYQIVLRVQNYKISNLFSFLGKYSLEIYLCQCLCLNIGIGTGYLRILTIFISASTISIVLSILTNKIKPLKTMLYGKF